ncbi:hypothetical protein NXS19_010699 [Fusarium pseudograminearum]|nr:hypothetical protein NXS19_010699 [Fusarium pseudograminearum]
MSQTTRPKVIFFDLDGTLFDDYHSLQCAIAEARHTVRIPDTKSDEELAATYLKARNTTYSDLQILFVDWSQGLYRRRTSSIRCYLQRSVSKLEQSYYGTIETLTKLKEMGYKIGIITNASAVSQQDKIDRIGIAHLIDGLFASHELGWAKPDPQIYHYALHEFNITPEMLEGEGKTYMVGDDFRCDVRGAWDAGLDPIVYAPPFAEPVPGWGWGFRCSIL